MFEIVFNPMESCLKPFVKKRCLKIIGDLQVDIVVAAMTMTSEREEVTKILFFLLFLFHVVKKVDSFNTFCIFVLLEDNQR